VTQQHVCPECFQPVAITHAKNIAGHFDTNPGRNVVCSTSGHPYTITLTRPAADDDQEPS
jgi:hypothetical protein